MRSEFELAKAIRALLDNAMSKTDPKKPRAKQRSEAGSTLDASIGPEWRDRGKGPDGMVVITEEYTNAPPAQPAPTTAQPDMLDKVRARLAEEPGPHPEGLPDEVETPKSGKAECILAKIKQLIGML